jgi:hypothetical protein
MRDSHASQRIALSRTVSSICSTVATSTTSSGHRA